VARERVRVSMTALRVERGVIVEWWERRKLRGSVNEGKGHWERDVSETEHCFPFLAFGLSLLFYL
jgi:hypothetical protein